MTVISIFQNRAKMKAKTKKQVNRINDIPYLYDQQCICKALFYFFIFFSDASNINTNATVISYFTYFFFVNYKTFIITTKNMA